MTCMSLNLLLKLLKQFQYARMIGETRFDGLAREHVPELEHSNWIRQRFLQQC
jgi:hypothetical protein